jgi:hypothetical protein
MPPLSLATPHKESSGKAAGEEPPPPTCSKEGCTNQVTEWGTKDGEPPMCLFCAGLEYNSDSDDLTHPRASEDVDSSESFLSPPHPTDLSIVVESPVGVTTPEAQSSKKLQSAPGSPPKKAPPLRRSHSPKVRRKNWPWILQSGPHSFQNQTQITQSNRYRKQSRSPWRQCPGWTLKTTSS